MSRRCPTVIVADHHDQVDDPPIEELNKWRVLLFLDYRFLQLLAHLLYKFLFTFGPNLQIRNTKCLVARLQTANDVHRRFGDFEDLVFAVR